MASSATRSYWNQAYAGPKAAPARSLAWPLVVLLGMICGATGTMVFQEGTLLLLHLHQGQFPVLVALFGTTPMPYQLDTDVLGLPALVTELAWGGFWGVPLAALLCRGQTVPMLASGAMFGAICLGGLLLVIVPTLHGWPILGHGQRQLIWVTLLICSAWGWGTALLLKLVTRR